MPLYVSSNENALFAQQAFNKNLAGLSNAMEQLASGLRINSPADDPAGFAMAATLANNQAALLQGAQNANQGLSLVQTAEAGAQSIQTILTSLTQLATEAANGTGSISLSDLNSQFQSLLTEANNIANTTTYNGINLLNGTTSSVTIQVGPGSSSYDTINVTLSNMTTGASGLNIASLNISTANSASSALTTLQNLTAVSSGLGSLGAGEVTLKNAANVDTSLAASLATAQSRIQGTDYASESSLLAKYTVMTQSSIAILSQANALSSMVLTLLNTTKTNPW